MKVVPNVEMKDDVIDAPPVNKEYREFQLQIFDILKFFNTADQTLYTPWQTPTLRIGSITCSLKSSNRPPLKMKDPQNESLSLRPRMRLQKRGECLIA